MSCTGETQRGREGVVVDGFVWVRGRGRVV